MRAVKTRDETKKKLFENSSYQQINSLISIFIEIERIDTQKNRLVHSL